MNEELAGPAVGEVVAVDELDLANQPIVADSWTPRWLVDVDGFDMGITVDDHCFVVLMRTEVGWKATKWLPWQIARRLGELVEEV